MREELDDEAEEGGRVAGDEVAVVLTVFAGLTDPARVRDEPDFGGDG